MNLIKRIFSSLIEARRIRCRADCANSPQIRKERGEHIQKLYDESVKRNGPGLL